MGIFDALNTAVGGLQSQSFALQNISGNIANSSTIGYKGMMFSDIPNLAIALGYTNATASAKEARVLTRASRGAKSEATSAADSTLLSHATFTSAKVLTSFFTASGRSSYSAAIKLQRHIRLSSSSDRRKSPG